MTITLSNSPLNLELKSQFYSSDLKVSFYVCVALESQALLVVVLLLLVYLKIFPALAVLFCWAYVFDFCVDLPFSGC